MNNPFPRFIWLVAALALSFPAQAARNILVFGDSLSAGYGIARDASWVSLLQKELRQSHPRFEVINASISGETAAGGLRRIGKALQQHQPEVVIIELGANDGLRGTAVAGIEKNLDKIVRQSRNSGAKVLLLGIQMPPNYGRDYTRRFRAMYPKLAKRHNVDAGTVHARRRCAGTIPARQPASQRRSAADGHAQHPAPPSAAATLMPNHLANETSPYLLQHADNPVDWYPWSDESLRLAREQDKPILLSIGYSACHWCHVMAHESFEDEAVAAVMNEHFVNIKVDREERPDLDQIYQNAHYLLTRRSGGWPLNLFLAPDGTPFYSGTYFPKQARYGLPGFPELLLRIAEAYKNDHSELAAQGQQLIAALAAWQPEKSAKDIELDAEPVKTAVQQLDRDFDSTYGGFGGAPKFLHPAELDLLLRQAHAQQDTHIRYVALFTLQQMALGGIYDQLGGGFCRYSVDERWDIPHFEKMLYDNGQQLGLHCDAWLSSGDPLFARVVEQTAGWVLREMQSPNGQAHSPHPNPDGTTSHSTKPASGQVAGYLPQAGEGANDSLRETNIGRGYYASLDADSEHEEGKFYVWQRDEVRALLSAEEYAVVAPYYGLDDAPNFEGHAWNLRVAHSLNEVAQKAQLSKEEASARLASAQAKLFTRREQRTRPGRDEKILGSWNGLMIAGMAKAARVFQRDDWLRSARRAMDFVRDTLWQDGKLLATHKDGKTHLNAYLDDHAFLLDAALELLQTSFAATTCISPCSSPMPCWRVSRTPRTAASSSPATTTKRSSSATRSGMTTPRLPATASPRKPCCDWPP